MGLKILFEMIVEIGERLEDERLILIWVLRLEVSNKAMLLTAFTGKVITLCLFPGIIPFFHLEEVNFETFVDGNIVQWSEKTLSKLS